MAKKKAVPKVPPSTVEPPRQRTIFALKGSEEFGEWLSRLARHVGLPQTNTVDQALQAYAELRGFKEPMPTRRTR
jgi:hypothetical protein